MTLHVGHTSKAPKWLRQEWGTPAYLFHSLHREFRYTVDGAARWVNAKLSRFWTRESSALTRLWSGERVWINPPYRDPGAWLSKAWREVWSGRCELATLLVPASFDVEWFDIACLGSVQPFRGRVQFEEPPELLQWRIENNKGAKTGGAGGGVMLVVYEPETIRNTVPTEIPIRMRSAKSGLYLPERFVA